MITKVLIAEDQESANISVRKTLDDLGVPQPDYAFYCDEALKKILLALQQQASYDLLITDLYFEEDHNKQVLTDGMALIAAARKVQPDLKVLVFTAEGKPAIIDRLLKLEVDGYVRKARNDAKELSAAIAAIKQHRQYFPRHHMHGLADMSACNLDDYDTAIIHLLAQGIRLKDIPTHFKQKDIQPAGLSSVEKRLNQIKDMLQCTTNEQLIAKCKDWGVI